MTPVRELDTRPIAEAFEVPSPPPKPASVFPAWSFCKAHRTWACFGCPQCEGTTLEYGGV